MLRVIKCYGYNVIVTQTKQKIIKMNDDKNDDERGVKKGILKL
jgi:hypothetical protein